MGLVTTGFCLWAEAKALREVDAPVASASDGSSLCGFLCLFSLGCMENCAESRRNAISYRFFVLTYPDGPEGAGGVGVPRSRMQNSKDSKT